MTDDIVARLREQANKGHARGCQGREYLCDCGYDLAVEGILEIASAALEAAEARVRELEAMVSALNADVHELGTRLSTIEAETIERCAGMAEGEIYRECYRTWPWWGTGNVSDEGLLASFGKDLAAAIRKLAQEVKHEAE